MDKLTSHHHTQVHAHTHTLSPDHLSNIGGDEVTYELFGVVVDCTALLNSRHDGRKIVICQNHLWRTERERERVRRGERERRREGQRERRGAQRERGGREGEGERERVRRGEREGRREGGEKERQ